ncbi:MAG: fatty acyl-CoA reductase [Myxococcota bacterium]|nr:fatty acyl-CoA reductase [Myxococcota bacterium]
MLRGKHVLITGTTGFVGKAILEKLMREVPDIGGIHLLIRPNHRYSTAQDRFTHEIETSSIFDSLKADHGDGFDRLVEERIHCVTARATEVMFGLSPEDYARLSARIDLLINAAASVYFREELDVALSINALSLHHIADFSLAAGDAPVVHVSTCYVNGFHQGKMREAVVAPAGKSLPFHADGYYQVEALIADLEKAVADVEGRFSGNELKKALVDLGIKEAHRYGWNDTYTFTKWIGEQIVLKRLQNKTVTILRPSIVESALTSPAPGWLEGVKVADTLILAYAKQKLAFFPAKVSGKVDIIPVDYVANSILLSLAETVKAPGAQRIYQCCSSGSNPISIRRFIYELQEEAEENYAQYDQLLTQKPVKPFIPVNRELFIGVIHLLKWMLRGIAFCTGKTGIHKTRTLKNVELASELSTIFSFYTSPSYTFHNDALIAMSKRMGRKDQESFPVDAQAIDWRHYLRNVHLAGLNKYVLKARKPAKQRVTNKSDAVALNPTKHPSTQSAG